MSEQKPTQPAPSPFHHTARAANPAMLVHLYREAAGAVLSASLNDSAIRDHIRMDVITEELVRRGLRELASDLNDEWMTQAHLKRYGDGPVAAVLGKGLAAIRMRVNAQLRAASA